MGSSPYQCQISNRSYAGICTLFAKAYLENPCGLVNQGKTAVPNKHHFWGRRSLPFFPAFPVANGPRCTPVHWEDLWTVPSNGRCLDPESVPPCGTRCPKATGTCGLPPIPAEKRVCENQGTFLPGKACARWEWCPRLFPDIHRIEHKEAGHLLCHYHDRQDSSTHGSLDCKLYLHH